MSTSPPREPRLTVAALLCILLLAAGLAAGPLVLSGCDGDEEENPFGPTAELKLQLRRDDGFAAGADYKVQVRWQGQVVTETGSEGATSFDNTKDYAGKTDANGDWTVHAEWIQLRPGSWNLTVTGDGWSHTCEGVELNADQLRVVSLTWGNETCSLGTSFP